MPAIVFPASTAPSVNPVENGGRLINAYAEKAPTGSRSVFVLRRVPGLDEAFTVGSAVARGALVVGTTLYVVVDATAYTVTKAAGVYTVTALSGSVGGTGLVTLAHNSKSPTNDIMVVTSAGLHTISGSTVSSFSDADLPSILHVAYQDGYFFYPSAFGRCYASDLNDTNITSTSYVTAESSPDGLVRAVPFHRYLLLMGNYSTEIWSNVGNATGFPYDRISVIPLGLFGINAVAGYEAGFPGPLMWVASNGKVYSMGDSAPVPVDFPDLERKIQAITDRTALRASVFVSAGHSFWVLSSDDWTFVYDHSTGEWHERASYGRDNWRCNFTINAFDEWLVFDDASAVVYRVNERSFREAAGPLVWEVRSTQQHNFPASTAISYAAFDFVTGVGLDRGIDPIESNPRVSISWSDDGGRTFSSPLLRELGTQGEYQRVEVRRTGTTKGQGRQWRLQISDPVEASLIGGSMFGEQLAV